MNTTLLNILYFISPLLIMGLIVKYAFKLNTTILLPSAIMLLLFVILTFVSTFTSKKFETQLYTLFCILQIVALIGGLFLMSKQNIMWKHFFVSLPFQILYWFTLFYYSGLRFTHKFEL